MPSEIILKEDGFFYKRNIAEFRVSNMLEVLKEESLKLLNWFPLVLPPLYPLFTSTVVCTNKLQDKIYSLHTADRIPLAGCTLEPYTTSEGKFHKLIVPNTKILNGTLEAGAPIETGYSEDILSARAPSGFKWVIMTTYDAKNKKIPSNGAYLYLVDSQDKKVYISQHGNIYDDGRLCLGNQVNQVVDTKFKGYAQSHLALFQNWETAICNRDLFNNRSTDLLFKWDENKEQIDTSYTIRNQDLKVVREATGEIIVDFAIKLNERFFVT